MLVIQTTSSKLCTVSNWQSTNDHIRIANRLHFVHIEFGDALVEGGVEIAQQCYNLHKSTLFPSQILSVTSIGVEEADSAVKPTMSEK